MLKKSQIAIVAGFALFGLGMLMFVLGMGMAPGENKTTVGTGAAMLISSIIALFLGLAFKMKETKEDNQ